jgi:IS5 family transposase
MGQDAGGIEPIYPQAGNWPRPYPLDTMLRIHCIVPSGITVRDGALEDHVMKL